MSAFARALRRQPLVVVNLVLFAALTGAGAWRATENGKASSPVPADLFMQSIASEDGNLGWNQLCPALQARLPRDVLEQQTRTQRVLQVQRGSMLSIDHIGDRPRPTGGEIRFYVGTTRDAAGASSQKTYVVTTEANGCVESVE